MVRMGRNGRTTLATSTLKTLPKFELKVILMHLKMLPEAVRPWSMPASRVSRLFFIMMIWARTMRAFCRGEACENGSLSCRETKGFVVHGVDLFAGEDAPGFQARYSGGFFGGFGMITSENFERCASFAQTRDGLLWIMDLSFQKAIPAALLICSSNETHQWSPPQ
jgi:hypothetical protein